MDGVAGASVMTAGAGAGARDGASDAPIVGILGCGVTGQAVGRALRGRGVRLAWHDSAVGVADRARRRLGGVVVDDPADLGVTDAVVVTAPVAHAPIVHDLIAGRCHVVSVSDDPGDVRELLHLHEYARSHGVCVAVGAALSPGLTGVLARHLADRLAVVDEIHVAMHGTAGPACARQHHDSLGATAHGWHDGDWIDRPGGSGRELCWFPDPIGPADCYRAGLADPVTLHAAFPEVERISARVSATRRDRLTARLPMLSPPHAEGDRGAIRVEVRGADGDGARVTFVLGSAGRVGDMAGTVAALFAEAFAGAGSRARPEPGVHLAGQPGPLSRWMMETAVTCGVSVHEFTGVARASAW